MGNLNINLNEIEETSGFDLVPEGLHEVKVLSAEIRESEDGKSLLNVKFEVVATNQWLFTTFCFVNPHDEKKEKQGRGILKGFTNACGIIGMLDDTADLLEKKLITKVKHNLYNGKTYANCNGFQSVDGSPVVKAGSVKSGTEKTEGVPATRHSDDEDDLPF